MDIKPLLIAAFFLMFVLGLSRSILADGPASAPAWTPPAVSLKTPVKHPVIAATPEELARLRAAWKSTGSAHDALAERFAKVDAAEKAGLVFPPEGGQHNQYYQCDKCQIALKTVDPHHHKCPKCGTVYTGFPYDNVLYSRTHSQNIYRAEDAAWAYAITGEKKYADFAARILTGYAERYLGYPMVCNGVTDKSIDVAAGKLTKYKSAGHINEQTLGEAMQLIPLSISYDLIYDAGALTDAQKKDVETKLLRAMAECIDVHRAGKSNWQTWHNAARLYAGAVLGDEAMVKQSLLEPKNGFAFQMTIGVLPEGMWFENSWGYHYYTLSAMTHIAEGSRHLGIDVYSHPMLKKMYLLAFDYRMADGSLPRLGDAVQDSPNRPGVNEFAYAAYKDPRLLTTLGDKPTFDAILLGRDASKAPAPAPAEGSVLLPGTGHALLRTDGPGKLSAAITFGPFGGFHGHFDKNTFVFFGFGEELAVDPGRAASQAYRLPIHNEWYRATAAHNGVTVDGQSQKGAEGRLISYAATPSYAAVVTSTGKAYENVDHTRLLLLTPTYLLVVDELKATDGKDHTFDWTYHNLGKSVECKLPAGDAKLEGAVSYKYLSDIKNYKTAATEPARVTITGDKLQSLVLLATQAGDQLFTATGPFKNVDDRVPTLVLRRKGKEAVFVSVIEPTLKDAPATVSAVAHSSDAISGHVHVERTGASDALHYKSLGAKVSLTTETPKTLTKDLLTLSPKE